MTAGHDAILRASKRLLNAAYKDCDIAADPHSAVVALLAAAITIWDGYMGMPRSSLAKLVETMRVDIGGGAS